MTDERLREFNKVTGNYGYCVCKAAFAKNCYDIYKMTECNVPEQADVTFEMVEEFIGELSEKQEGNKMMQLEEIKEAGENGEYYAVGDNGRQYDATFTTGFGGLMFFCVPSDVQIIGYIPR